MKYKVGDTVRIRSWESMKAEFGLFVPGAIKCSLNFILEMEEFVKNNNRIIMIKAVYSTSYVMENNGWGWSDDMIECLASEYKEPEPEIFEVIETRFEILDL